MNILSKTISLTLVILFISACTSAYSSHHGNRAGRYNNVPYDNNNYRYKNNIFSVAIFMKIFFVHPIFSSSYISP